MKTLFIECQMGAAGDMLMAALMELLPDPEAFIERMNHIGIPSVHVHLEKAVKCGITGSHVSVHIGDHEEESHDVAVGQHHHHHEHEHHHDHPHEHHHTGLEQIEHILAHLDVSDRVKRDALAVYILIAEAESKAHGKPVEAVHFHEVGMMDAVADIVGVCMLIELLAPEKIIVSPIHVGSGQVKCAHGILPVPTPATASILHGVPTYGGQIQGELCTPTGAALLKYFANAFGDRPVMATETVGYGMGKKDFPIANCVRAFIGRSQKSESDITELVCNIDDMTGEDLRFALDVLMENGALDVYTTSIQMKKGRSGYMLTCLCKTQDEEKMAQLMLYHTTTIGLRTRTWNRYTLDRNIQKIDTEFGSVRIKASSGYGVEKAKMEYDDLASIAKEQGISLSEVRGMLQSEMEK